MLFRSAFGACARWTMDRLGGLWLLGAALSMVLISVSHGGLLSAPVDLAVEHLTNVLNLLAWPTLVTINRRLLGLGPGSLSRPTHHIVPAIAYLAYVLAAGGRAVPFLWILPVGIACTAAIGAAWFSVHRQLRVETGRWRRVSGVFVFAVAFVGAQTIRTLFPEVVALREIVPAVFTASFFAIGYSVAGPVTLRGAAPEGVTPGEQPRYQKSALTPQRAGQLVRKLDERMCTEHWYRATDLSLQALASRLGVSSHTLSQAINQQRGQSLPQYLIQWRVREAKRMLADPANDCFTVEALAERSGFASRSAFYKVFRKAEGITPTDYRERARRINAVSA